MTVLDKDTVYALNGSYKAAVKIATAYRSVAWNHLVERLADPLNRRRRMVRLTTTGEEVLQAMATAVAEISPLRS